MKKILRKFVAGSWSGSTQLVSLMSLVFAIQTKEIVKLRIWMLERCEPSPQKNFFLTISFHPSEGAPKKPSLTETAHVRISLQL